jgi:hypothetical protein
MMVSMRREVTIGLVAAAALALVAPSASAATTTIRAGGATGAPYSGNVQVSLLGPASVTTVFGTGSCNQGSVSASVQSNGTNLSISAASFTNDPGPDCPVPGTSSSVTVTSENLPWGGGNVTYAPVAGGRDATITLSVAKVKAVTHNVPILGTITCYYGGTVTASGYNPTNPSRPDTSVTAAQGKIDAATLNKINSGSSIYCPGTASITGNFEMVGQGSSGAFDQTLYVTS